MRAGEAWTQPFSTLMKWNESGFRSLLCTYRLNWARKPPEDGEVSEMTLPFRYRIRNSNPGGLRPSTLPLSHKDSSQYWVLRVDGEETFLFLSNRRDRKTNPVLFINTKTARGSILKSDSDVYARQALTSKVNPRTVGVNISIMTVDP